MKKAANEIGRANSRCADTSVSRWFRNIIDFAERHLPAAVPHLCRSAKINKQSFMKKCFVAVLVVFVVCALAFAGVSRFPIDFLTISSVGGS